MHNETYSTGVRERGIAHPKQNSEVSLSTFIPLKIRKRGGRRVVVGPDGESLPQGSTSTPFDTPLLVALSRAFYWQQLIDDGVVESGTDITQREGLHLRRTHEQEAPGPVQG